ncbi:MAG: heavy-metal-associated domain-containing protein [Flavobacteriales bacterium]
MKYLLPLSFSIALLAGSCSGTATNEAISDAAAQAAAAGIERVVTDQVINTGTPITTADLAIDGMSCEMMCGGSIKKALAKLPGISGTEITFVEGDERDHAIVTYDPAQVSDAQMIEAIQALHDGQYQVKAVHITRQVLAAGAEGAAPSTGGDAASVQAYLPRPAVLPSLVALLSQILRS